jgi:hypothetical protein
MAEANVSGEATEICHRSDMRVLLVLLGPDPSVPYFSGEFDGCTQIDALLTQSSHKYFTTNKSK